MIVSQGWPDVPAPVTPLNGLEWEYVNGNGQLDKVYHECKRFGYDLIDLQTGEFFDDIDLGTVSTFESGL